MLLQEEHELMQLLPSGTSEASWTNKFSQDDWDLVRQKTSLDDRKALADGWTLLSKMVLASTANSTWGVNCLRRAVAWHPGFVPAYLETSTFLENLGYKNGSCQTMEKMLERVDPTEFRSGEMRSILTSNFPHCSVIIRMANLWENNILFRYIVAASVIVSFLHGLCVAIYFFHDKFRFCCPSKREEHEQQPSDHVKPSSKKSKRD
ncbi:TPA: hypothetical protein N0F65_008598 [Lagenidium giganteum]|uniref:Uncharacterized protein n=1 Tax=Lagenidium giganteum TaxID=4803 RepID=A0AAV2Z0A9_9STRA|nr:TPA: hypothetical protein N0F65_008598 [Lagenidium giganteum]